MERCRFLCFLEKERRLSFWVSSFLFLGEVGEQEGGGTRIVVACPFFLSFMPLQHVHAMLSSLYRDEDN